MTPPALCSSRTKSAVATSWPRRHVHGVPSLLRPVRREADGLVMPLVGAEFVIVKVLEKVPGCCDGSYGVEPVEVVGHVHAEKAGHLDRPAAPRLRSSPGTRRPRPTW